MLYLRSPEAGKRHTRGQAGHSSRERKEKENERQDPRVTERLQIGAYKKTKQGEAAAAVKYEEGLRLAVRERV